MNAATTSGHSGASILNEARALVTSGLSVIPIKPDGSKRPACAFWEPYQSRRAWPSELDDWFGVGKGNGLAILGGKVSGNLEFFDLEATAPLDEFKALVDEAAPGLLEHLPRVETP